MMKEIFSYYDRYSHNAFDIDSYYKFGFTREPSSRLKSFLKYKLKPQSLSLDNYDNKCNSMLRNDFKSTKNWFFNECDDFIVDHVYKFEELEQSMQHICEIIGLKPAIEFNEFPVLKDSKNFEYKPEQLNFINSFVSSPSTLNNLKVSHAWEYSNFYSESLF